MTTWLCGECVLIVAALICAAVLLRGRHLSDRLVALQMLSLLTVLALLILAQAMSRPSFFDLALALAILSFPGALLYAHFVERWLR